MERSEAEARARRLRAEHPERDSYRFLARHGADDDWQVAKLRAPRALRRSPLTPTITASPRPSPADDPRTATERLAPGLPGGV